jgi:phosphate:Na+ symporter
MNASATACAGLGVFFIGMRLVSSHLRELASGSIRKLLAKTLGRPGVASFAGLCAGALTQSTSAVTFIATGLVTAGALTLTVAVAMLVWANAGTAALVLLASLNVHALALYLLGIIGLAFFNGLDQQSRFRHVVYALFGLGLLLLGLTLVKQAVAEVRDDYWVRDFIEFTASGAGISLLAGFVLATALQSSSVVAALALPLAAEGLLDLHGMTLLILGACAGSGAAVVLVSSSLEGPARQLAITQGIIRSLASLLLLPLVLAEGHGYPIGLATAAEAVTHDLPAQVGQVFLYVQVVGIVIAWTLKRPVLSLAAWAAPSGPGDTLSKPAYLYDDAVGDPGTALELVRLEHVRLINALPDYLEDLRDDGERNPNAPPLSLRASASDAVAVQMEDFLTELIRENPEMSTEHIFDARRRIGDLTALQKSLAKFVSELSTIPAVERPAFVRSLVEGLHALLMVVAEACDQQSHDARDLLHELTAERGALVNRVRQELLAGNSGLVHRESLLSAVLLLERVLWILRERSPLPFHQEEKSTGEAKSAPAASGVTLG